MRVGGGHLTPTAETASIVEAAVDAVRPVVGAVQVERVEELSALVHETGEVIGMALGDGGAWVKRLLVHTKPR
jgi:hypothetical protein